MSNIPRDRSPDSTLSLLSDGYAFIPKRCRRYRSDLFRTRLMLTPVVCMQGEAAARQFYCPDRFTREGAMPFTTLMLLQDRGSVQLRDGDAHRHRKQMFMSMMGAASRQPLVELFAEEWRQRLRRWERMDEIVLNDEMEAVLTRAVCRWTGVPLREREVGRRTRELAAMISGAGRVGPRNWTALLLRERTERWARGVIDGVRAGEVDVPEETPLRVIAWHRDESGALLDTGTAAVELLNLLRPTVAVARYITFAALALHQNPEMRERLQADDALLEPFVQEVRRYYPFFPFIGGRVNTAFDWRGHHFAVGNWVLLDLYGTNHDPRVWDEPQVFRPDRFHEWNGSAWNFIPQGAGDHATTHRCPGEWITIDLMKRAVQLLVNETAYDVPPQDLHIDLSRMPALPESGLVMSDVQRAG